MNPSSPYRFNVRVYAILIENGNVLVTDEFRMGREITKFPGGGLQFGEGTIECLKRECREELGQETEVLEHFYVTDFFQLSAFNENEQIISIYYRIKLTHEPVFKISESLFDFPEKVDGGQSFRWISLRELSENDFTFPIDKKVGGMLRKQFEIRNPKPKV